MDRISQTMQPPHPPNYPQSFCLLNLSFRYLSTLSLSFALSIPKSFFSPDCLSLIKLLLNLETYFSKSPGLKREETTDKMASLIHVYHLLFISLTNVELSQKFPVPFCLSEAAITFSCPPIKCHWLHSRLRRPHLNRQRAQMTSFSLVGLCFIQLRLVEILIEYFAIKITAANVLSLSLAFITHPLYPQFLC